MTTTEAKKEGIKAFNDGKSCAPALNNRFLVIASKTGNLVNLMKAYIDGWTIANLADGAIDNNMPSVRKLAEIEAA